VIPFTERLDTLVEAGSRLTALLNDYKQSGTGDNFLRNVLHQAEVENAWFTETNVVYVLENIAADLEKTNLEQWLSNYPGIENIKGGKKVGIIMAGNIPLVSWRDMLGVLITGNHIIGKLSAKDKILVRFITDHIMKINPEFSQLIGIEEGGLKNFDAVIATGSNNSARYFDYYFGKYPGIIRKNKNSVAVISEDEKEENLKLLADDVFLFFGLGCRNVSKIYVPRDFDFAMLFKAFEKYSHLINHNKYSNNYIYNRAIYLVNKLAYLDNGFLLLKEDEAISSPVGVLYYEHYNDFEDMEEKIFINRNSIQCIVSEYEHVNKTIKFGRSQKPELCDYSDNVDILRFLINLHNISNM
jgi:hypothetical protein